MCGLTGIWDRRAATGADELHRTVTAMRDTLAHRGPDDAGALVDAELGLALGFRRLAIVDLTPTGHQPMASADGRFVAAYNGEIYNHGDLRRELEAAGVAFRGSSDTEVMVEGFARWGVKATARRLNGMFAVAVFDRADATLHLLRDRLGIKPLYWARFGSLLLFGSELKSLRRHPGWSPEIDRGAMAAFLRFGYVPAPHTIYQGVHKLEPGMILTLGRAGEERIEPTWTLADAVRAGAQAPLDLGDNAAIDQFEALLKDAIGRQMVADVPLGAFLSGGIDSSTVVALMQAQSPRPVKTFTIGFREPGFDESAHADAVARHLGTEHTSFTVEPAHAREVIPKLPELYDEPFADPSQIPTFLLSELTRRHVTVALSGDGGDELLSGYERYRVAESRWATLRRVPRPIAALSGAACRLLPAAAWDRGLQLAPRRIRSRVTGEAMHGLGDVLGDGGFSALYRRQLSQWAAPEQLLPGVAEPRGLMFDRGAETLLPGIADRMRYLDTLTYLPDDILAKVDRASMGVSLEARVPLLDHRVVEFCWRLPPQQIVRAGTSKWLLRQVLDRHVPPALIDRPKMGFGVPIDAWLRGPLRDWAETLLAERNLRHSRLEPGPVRRHWREHLAGERNWQYRLWTVLMLQAWSQRWMAAGPADAI